MTEPRAQLLTPEQALARVLARVRPLGAERVPLASALGRVLAEPVASRDDIPSADNSAMDGFAVRAADTAGASAERPVRLAVVTESRAGRPADAEVAAGQAGRVSTGATLPDGTDAVVRKEDCEDLGEAVEVRVEVGPGREVRRAGEDVRTGEAVLEAGMPLGPAEVAVLASVGAAEPLCARRPRVAIVTTGDELVDVDAALAPGQVRNSNLYALVALAQRCGAEVVSAVTIGDDRERTVEALERGLGADVLITSGGVSVGEHDHVKGALAELAVEQDFWGVALRPGHPTWFGARTAADGDSGGNGACLVFGLPGNPVSAMVTFHLFVAPALKALCGIPHVRRITTAVMDADYPKRPGRAHVVRCVLDATEDGWHVRPTKAQGSHVLTSMLGAEALALLDAERGDVKAGEKVPVELL